MIAGIDLGTTHSLIGVYDSGFPTLLADNEGSRITPSVVYYPEHGIPLVGRAAERQQLLDPERTITSVKRLMGRRKDDPECKNWNCIEGLSNGSISITLGKKKVSPEEVSAEILKELKKIAEGRLGTPLSRAVITVPAYFNDAQRIATRKAGEIAGFTVERIISEPTAAALAYGLDKLHDQAKIAVYDLGGGTFDLSILQLDHGIFQVLSTHGDTHLGGDDIDRALAEFLLKKSSSEIKKPSLSHKHPVNPSGEYPSGATNDQSVSNSACSSKSSLPSSISYLPSPAVTPASPAYSLQPTASILPAGRIVTLSSIAKNRLHQAARKAKEELSSSESTIVRLPFLQEEISIEVSLTRQELEAIAYPIIQRTYSLCLRALADAKLKASDLDEIILVGGSTRMPLVRTFVQELFGKTPNLSQHPDEAVALGAVLQGALLEGNLPHVTLLDITPLSLGIETFGGLMNVIIPRNTTIPTKAGEMFTNAVAGQSAMRITLLQGERELAADNWKLGELEIAFPPAPKGAARVGVQFEIDADGLLHVLARDIASGKEKLLEVRNAIEISDEAVESMLADSLEHALEDMDARIFTEARLKAEEMLPAVEKALTQLLDEIPSEIQALIRSLANNVKAALQSQATTQLKKALQELDEATQPLATLLVERALNLKA